MGRHRGWGFLAGACVAALALSSCAVGYATPADQVTDYGAQLHGEVVSTVTGEAAYHFEYGTTTAYGSTTPNGRTYYYDTTETKPVSAKLTGLAEGTEYHYRLCATDVDGSGGCGPDQTFTTTSGHDYVFGEGITLDLGFAVFGGRVGVQSDPDGSNPTGRAGGVPGARYVRYFDEGPVTCLRVEGNRAAIGYLADPVGIGIPGDLPVPEMVFVEDNGPTGDRWSGVRVLDEAATTCPTPTAADFPDDPPGSSVLTRGDFTVRDLVPTP